VNAKAEGKENGSVEHPYRTIAQAIDKAKGGRTNVHVAKGKYEENITLKNGVRLFGEDKEKTIIKAEKSKWAVVYFKENSEINGFTLEGGQRGIWVDKYSEAKIINCVIKNNKEDGIGIEGGKDTKKENVVLVSKTEIKNNGNDGIFLSGKRRVTIMDNNIWNNRGDGIDLASGTNAWIAGNRVKANRENGMKLVLDGASIWTKDNGIRDNKKDGVEVTFLGGEGRIDLAKSKIVDNGGFGIMRLQNATASSGLWATYLTYGNKTEFWGNVKGNVSSVLRLK
jgi:parallel beta-helix repeat protein